MDELEYRLRDLDVVGQNVGRLPAAAEVRRRGDRKRTIQRITVAVSTFVLVAVLAGGATAWLNRPDPHTSGTPAGPVEPVPSQSSPPASDDELPNQKSDALTEGEAGQYWIWAPPTSDGKRMLTVEEDGSLSLSRSNKSKAEGEWLNYRGQILLSPAGWNRFTLAGIQYTEEADAYCVTVVETGYDMEVCDDGDEKQGFAFTQAEDGGYTIEFEPRSQYLKAEGRKLTWTDSRDEATVFALEKAGD